MPLPKPGKKEGHDEFISRCMADDVMTDEYEDEDQRLAVCESQWDKERSMAITEYRTFELDTVEVRADEGEGKKIRGHAAVFDKLSEDLGGFREQIAPGSFARSLERDVRALWNHDPNYILGRTKSGTLRLEEDDKGLAVEIDPPDTTWARDLIVSIERKDVTQMSFAFTVNKDEMDETGKIRTLRDVNLFDVSPVTFPAYPQTDVGLRDLAERLRRELGIEDEEAEQEQQEEPEETVTGVQDYDRLVIQI